MTKKGKGFGGTSWKNRYFALKSGIMECYEEKESPATTGTINLRNCTIIRSVPGHENEEEYAFAFVIFEYKKGTFTDGMTRAPEDAKVLSKFILHCVDEAEKLEWCRAIQGNIDLARKTSQLYDELRKKPFVRPYLHGEEQESKEIRHESETNMELIKEHQSSQRSLLDNPSFISNHSEVDLTAGSNMPTIIPRESSVSVQSASVSDEVSRIMNQKANQISFLTESASAGGSTDMLSSSTRLAKKSNKKRLAGAFNWAKKKSFVGMII